MSEQWFYSRGGKQTGPVSGTELKQLAASGQISSADMVWKDGMSAWVPARSLKGLFNAEPPAMLVSPGPSSGSGLYPADTSDSDYRQATDSAGALAAVTATEFGLSSIILSGITLIGGIYPLVGALVASSGGTAGAILMLLFFLLLSILACILGGMGLNRALRKGQSGATYCMVGIIVSVLAFISSIMMLVAVSNVPKRPVF